MQKINEEVADGKRWIKKTFCSCLFSFVKMGELIASLYGHLKKSNGEKIFDVRKEMIFWSSVLD